jgi:ASCH domain
MKAISIRQPWAWAIMHAGKDIENRQWSTRVRGRVLVHAAKGLTRDEYQSTLDWYCTTPLGTDAAMPRMSDLARGGIIGSVEIVDCVTKSSSPWFFGFYGFVLRNPQPLPFVPFCGSLGFFDVPDHLIKRNDAEMHW